MTAAPRHLSALRPLVAVVVVVFAAMALAGCSIGDDADSKVDKSNKESKSEASQTGSYVILNGRVRGEDGTFSDDPELDPDAERPTARSKKTTGNNTTEVELLPEPPLNADGTLVDTNDPFEGLRVAVQPVPIEDDPEITRALDLWGQQMRRIDIQQYQAWMRNNAIRPNEPDPDAPMASMVKVLVQRCGGARTVASGIVLADGIVVTTMHAVESPKARIRITPASGGSTARIPAMIQYLDVDDDIAVLKVPGLQLRPLGMHVVTAATPQWGRAYGVSPGGTTGVLRRAPVMVAMQEQIADVEQPVGFAQRISDRSIYPVVGAIDSGFSGGIVTGTNDPGLAGGWGFHGLIRARVPYRSETGGVLVPSRLVTAALDANDRLDPWFEHRPGVCPQWHR